MYTQKIAIIFDHILGAIMARELNQIYHSARAYALMLMLMR